MLTALGIVVGVGTAVGPGVIKKDTNAKNAGAATAHRTNLATVWLMRLLAGTQINIVKTVLVRVTRTAARLYAMASRASGYSWKYLFPRSSQKIKSGRFASVEHSKCHFDKCKKEERAK